MLARLCASVSVLALSIAPAAAQSYPSPTFQTHTDITNPTWQSCAAGKYVIGGGSSAPMTCATPQIGGTTYVSGAACNGATDDTSAIQAALTTASAGGAGVSQVVVLPGGICKISSGLSITGSVTLTGSGANSTFLAQTCTTCVSVSMGAGFVTVENIGIEQLSGTPTAGEAISMSGFYDTIYNVTINGTWNGIEVSGSQTTINNVLIGQTAHLVGTDGIAYSGTGFGQYIINTLIQSNASGTNNNTNLVGIKQVGNQNSLLMDTVTVLQGGPCLKVDGTNSTTGIITQANILSCDHNTGDSIQLVSGDDFQMTNSWIGSNLAGNGMQIDAGFTGEVIVTGSRFYGNYFHGIFVNSGPTNLIFSNNLFEQNGQQAANTYNGLSIGVGVSHFSATGNIVCGPGSDSQAFGILVATGASNNYVIQGNLGEGCGTASVHDGGTGGSKSVSGNI